MKIQEKPDYLIFADSAKNGECVNFPDVSRGWGVTIDQTASKPPLEWMNGAFNRIDKNMMYLLQQGVPEWCEYVKYPVDAIIKYNGVLYTAIVENDNTKPSTNTTEWKKTIAEVPTASVTREGVVKLNSDINSESETEAATPRAVKFVNDRILPVGIPQPWPTNKPPAGWFECNGSTFDKIKFPKLAKAYPSGKLPDLRGEFIRGWDNTRGADPQRGILSWQNDAIRNIYGEISPISESFGANPIATGAFRYFEKLTDHTPVHIDVGTTGGVTFDASRIVPTANENRPRNIAFMYIVKAE